MDVGETCQRIEAHLAICKVKYIVQVHVDVPLAYIILLKEIVETCFTTEVVNEVVRILSTDTEVCVTMVDTNVEVATNSHCALCALGINSYGHHHSHYHHKNLFHTHLI